MSRKYPPFPVRSGDCKKEKIMRLPKSIRIRIYDAVKAGVDEKGCWTASEDGFEGRTITREERNILQDLVNHGYVKR